MWLSAVQLLHLVMCQVTMVHHFPQRKYCNCPKQTIHFWCHSKKWHGFFLYKLHTKPNMKNRFYFFSNQTNNDLANNLSFIMEPKGTYAAGSNNEGNEERGYNPFFTSGASFLWGKTAWSPSGIPATIRCAMARESSAFRQLAGIWGDPEFNRGVRRVSSS